MNYVVFVPIKKFDIGMTNWLEKNVSGQGVLWKVEIDMWERRAVYFEHKGHLQAFKAVFSI
jgi:hypothetical protein